jgi:ferrous iron transport protein B
MTGKSKFKTILVGCPNVGKSSIFYNLTGRYATVSNYPGTTVNYIEGKTNFAGHHNITIIDTPGLYSLSTITEEEEVAKKLILEESPDAVLHIIDAKNIERMLPLTLQLIEAGLPVILVLNMIDELKKINLDIQIAHLEHDLGIPVVETSATKNIGIKNLKARLLGVAEDRYKFSPINIKYPTYIENLIVEISSLIKNEYVVSRRAISILLIKKDESSLKILEKEKNQKKILSIIEAIDNKMASLDIEHTRFSTVSTLIKEYIIKKETRRQHLKELIDKLTLHPLVGLIIVLLILYLGLYKFVGQFGAGFLVEILENFYEKYINTKINLIFTNIFGDNLLFHLFAGDYGIFTFALRYGIAIVLPIVAIFFLFFSFLEDSGYLVRLSMFLDNTLKKIGLSGRSAIPLVLGLGCGTMAVVVTRTLETIRERYIATFLLALVIPCSAQVGVILAMVGSNFLSLIIWIGVILIIFTVAGFVLNKIMRGNPPSFFMEVPPLRMPSIRNIFLKTYSRLKWYFFEVIPVFILASILIWIGKITLIFDFLSYLFSYPAIWAGLPEKVGEIFLYGFFRRDFGIAGLYDLKDMLSLRQIVVACVILTLFVPCIAQFTIMIKERGIRAAIFIFLTVTPFAFIIGIMLNLILRFVNLP